MSGIKNEVKIKNIKKLDKRIITAIIITVTLIIILGIFSVIFAISNIANPNIMSGVHAQNIDLSGLSIEESRKKIKEEIQNIKQESIVFMHNEYETMITPEQLELNVDIENILSESFSIGRSENIILNNYEILGTNLFGKNIEIPFEINQNIVENVIDNMSDQWKDTYVENYYYIEGENLIITDGNSGVVVDKERLKALIYESMQRIINGEKNLKLEVPVIEKNIEKINIEEIYEKIHKNPQDAYFKDGMLYPHVNGVEFKITIEEAKELLKEEKEEYVIPLKIEKPEVLTSDLGNEAFPDIISTYTTLYAAGSNRGKNIEVCANSINDVVIMPGEVFTFNSTIGVTTPEKGYLKAGSYANGQLVESYGGGVCQVSSTLYNAVLYANLEIVERHNHSAVVSYVAKGRDATVAYGVKDFKFKNSRNYAIKISAKAIGGRLQVDIKGIKEKEEYEIIIESFVTQEIEKTVQYITDSSLAKGEEEIVTEGANGAKSITYKTIKKGEEVLAKTVISEDNYNPLKKVIKKGK